MYRLYMCQLPTLTSFTCITQHPAFPVCTHLKPVFVFNVISTLYIVWRTRELKNEFQKLLAATNRADSQSLCKHLYFVLPATVNLQMLSLLSWARVEQGLLTATSPHCWCNGKPVPTTTWAGTPVPIPALTLTRCLGS